MSLQPAGEKESLSATGTMVRSFTKQGGTSKSESPYPQKRHLGEVGGITLVESLPLSVDCKASTSNIFHCLLSFYTSKI